MLDKNRNIILKNPNENNNEIEQKFDESTMNNHKDEKTTSITKDDNNNKLSFVET